MMHRVNLGKSKISIFDNGPGLDDTDENSLVKWYLSDSILFHEHFKSCKLNAHILLFQSNAKTSMNIS